MGTSDWHRVDLGDKTSAKISAKGDTVIVTQDNAPDDPDAPDEPAGAQDTIVLSAAQLRRLLAALDQQTGRRKEWAGCWAPGY